MAIQDEKGSVGMGGRLCKETGGDGFRRGRAASTIFYHPKTQVRVVVHGDDFTFAGTEWELRKIEAMMHEWYDVKVRGILGSGKRDVHEIEILGRNLTSTEEGLEYEGSDKHRRALPEGLGLNEESKAVNSAGLVKKRTRICWTRRKRRDSEVWRRR